MSTTKNLGLFKHDNPSTNTDRFDVDKAINQNWDKTDEAIGQDRERLDLLEASNTIYNFKGKVDTLANLQLKTKTKGDVWYCEEDSTYYAYNGTEWIPVNLNLKLGVIDELKAKTIKCLQEVETPTPVSGTSIDLSDSAEAKFSELKISGNSKQETRRGKNKLNSASIGVGTNNGITCTYDSKTGIITFNGACNADNTRFTFENTSIPFTNNLTKILAYYVSGTITTYCLFRTFDSNWGAGETLNLLDLSSSKNKTRIISSNTTIKTNIDIRFNNGSVANNFKIKLMITDSENDEYEQYGAMPSPDYPSDNESCGDNINLFDKNNVNSSSTVFITSDGKQAGVYDGNYSIYIKCKANTTYTISNSQAPSRFRACSVENLVTQQINVPNGKVNDGGTSITITTGANDKYLYVNTGSATYNEKLKIEEGSIARIYTPYGQGSINEVICNKNLANIEKFNIAGGTGTTYPKTIQGLKENTEYTISFYKSRIAGATISNTAIHGCRQMHFYHNEEKLSEYTYNSPVSGFSSGNKKFEIKITTPAKCNKVICYFDNANGDNNINTTVYDIQLEEGNATDYEEHKSQTYTIPTQQPIRSIEIARNTFLRDTFIKKNNKWYERHYEVEIVVDGTETINKSSSKEFFSIAKTTSNIDTSANAVNVSKSNYGTGTTLGLGEGNTNNKYSFNASTIYLDCYGSNINTVDKLKAQLSETPMKIYALLKTPLDIECTEEQSTILWDIEQNAKTYDKVTHMYSTDKISSYKEVTHKKDIETLFANTLIEEVG